MKRNLDKARTFFDPHPGFGGAAISIPVAVQNVAKKLTDGSMSLREAMDKIQAVTGGIVSVKKNWIGLELQKINGPRHIFRVISFK